MSVRDMMPTQNPIQLLSIGTTLGLLTASSSGGGKYNFPLLLFGVVAHEIPSSNILLHQFISLLAGSILLDLYHLIFDLSGFSLLISFLLIVLKFPIFLSSMDVLKQRGEEFQVPGTGIGLGAGFSGMGYQRAEQGQGQGGSNWSMPGGLATPASLASAAPPPSQFPTTGGYRLGGEEDLPPLPQGGGGPPPQARDPYVTPQPQPKAGRGGYRPID